MAPIIINPIKVKIPAFLFASLDIKMSMGNAKRNAGILTFIGLIIIGGHWVDVYIMVTAGSMGPTAHIGLLEIGMALTVMSIFILVILKNLTKAPLTAHNHPFLDESIHHEI